jgi:hypothetical protein
MTPAERDRIVSYARGRQLSGDLLAWSIDESLDQVEFLVPLDASGDSFPERIGSTRIILTWLPRAKELSK